MKEALGKLVRREMSAKPPSSVPRWICVETANGRFHALAFVSNPRGPVYAGGLAIEEVAAILSRACGHWGSGAEYLHNTIVNLEERGIHDSYLWRLQALVADEIAGRFRTVDAAYASKPILVDRLAGEPSALQ